MKANLALACLARNITFHGFMGAKAAGWTTGLLALDLDHTRCKSISILLAWARAACMRAGITFNGFMGAKVAVISQEDAAVWVGEFDWEALEFVGKGKVGVWGRGRRL